MLIIEKELRREIMKMNGDRSREARIAMRDKVYAASVELSSTQAPYIFADVLKRHGRAAVALAVASTLWENRGRLENWNLDWALAVLKLWETKRSLYTETAAIRDGLHPTRICEYAGEFIRMTGERVDDDDDETGSG